MGKLLNMPGRFEQNEFQKLAHWLKLADAALHNDEAVGTAEANDRDQETRKPLTLLEKLG